MGEANTPYSRALGEAIEHGRPTARSGGRGAALIQHCITRLVQEAPAVDAGTVSELVRQLGATPEPGTGLARSIAQVVELVAARRIDPGIALPHLAMACATLVDPALTTRELEAARYEIDTLLPVPGAPPVAASSGGGDPAGSARGAGVLPRGIDVPLSALTRGPRPRT